jgi:hypothetical protein
MQRQAIYPNTLHMNIEEAGQRLANCGVAAIAPGAVERGVASYPNLAKNADADVVRR